MSKSLVVKSAAKELIKGMGCNCSADALDKLSDKIEADLKVAVARAQGNKRKTVKSIDI